MPQHPDGPRHLRRAKAARTLARGRSRTNEVLTLAQTRAKSLELQAKREGA